jgi:LytS/YehU family sensor histidine kinase
MVIQLLVENAIKHNIISTQKPLSITIFIENEYLIISNNLQLKSSREISSKTGLDNIRKRYEYLTNTKVIIDETPEFFKVKIPLL